MLTKKLLKFCFSTQKVAGNVYTWGKTTAALGYEVGRTEQSVDAPKIIQDFAHNAAKVVMGQGHSAVLTTDNQLYTFGGGSKGQLGHNDNEYSAAPKIVNYFAKNNLKVVDVSLGKEFTMALTEDGDVWTWGYGGREWNWLMKLFTHSTGPLGHGDILQRHTPTPVQELRKFDPITNISCGLMFCNSLNAKGQLFNWGIGEYGVFGHGDNKSERLPIINDYFEHLDKNEGLTIKKLKACNQYNVALMSNGKLYGWGCNEFGQIGIKNEIGVEIYETANFPIQVHDEDFPAGAKVVDYCIGENIMGILFDNNEVFWSGKKIAYTPERMKLPENVGKIKKIGAVHHNIVAVDENNKIYFTQDFMKAKETNDRTGISWNDNEQFGGGNILDIGGTYQNKFAIVDNSQQ